MHYLGLQFGFQNLTAGVAMTLRATAPGWTTQDKTVTPAAAGAPVVTVYFYLSKLP